MPLQPAKLHAHQYHQHRADEQTHIELGNKIKHGNSQRNANHVAPEQPTQPGKICLFDGLAQQGQTSQNFQDKNRWNHVSGR